MVDEAPEAAELSTIEAEPEAGKVDVVIRSDLRRCWPDLDDLARPYDVAELLVEFIDNRITRFGGEPKD